MSAPTGVTSPASGTPAGPEPERRPPPRFVRYLLPVAASWLIPVLTHLVHADVLLLPALVVAVAAQLTIGRTLLDRLVPALGLVGGLAIAAGLVFSAWPWGLNPVPLAGSSFTVLSVLAVRTYERTGRRPGLPRRLAGSDLVLLAASGYGAWVAAAPSLRGTPTAGLGYTTLTGDRMRQFTLFDAIHRSGGYPFLNWTSAQSVADPKVGRVYPSGMHYLYALVDVFVRSDTAPGNPVAELDRYRWYVALGFGFLVLAVTWAARWVLGAGRPCWQRALVTAAVGA
ncbi:MAG: hypothetical protein HOV83_22465, partial [Catenulispora sp.]|nr:hypothetical protein [Catenulispora sp.]